MWHSININKTSIKASTDRAVLIRLPHSSEYDGFLFWHPLKLVREGRNSGSVSVSFADGWSFKCFKEGKGITNKYDHIQETELGCDEILEAFDKCDSSITAPQHNDDEMEVHTPSPVEPKKAVVPEELKDE